jgi:hypothetical protein
MSNYSKTTDFEAKDSLPTGDSGKIIRGAEFETEFDAISTAIATKADTAGPTFTGTLTFETISDGTIGVTAFVDEDDMSSDSATLVPTQQSVKAYVDSQVTAQDLDFQADSGGALSIDLDSETLTFTGGTGVDTSGSGNAVTFAIDSTVATLTGSQTLTNKTLTSPDVNTPDIDGGTIDGTVIGGATPAAVSATTVSATGNITVGGTVDGRDVATDGSKLDGIETGATADQTAAEIRTLVESASDSNVFTDADHSKLDGIEANADVTDTANVTAAGALMDSELTSIASVKALNQGVATTDSPTFAAVTVNGNVEFDGLSGTGSVTVTDILDQDDMSGNSATALATQQSIKAYVDSQVAGADTLAEVLANGNTTGGTDIAVGTGDDITFADSSKAVFGAGSDLQIYHDGTNSYIVNTTNDLIIGEDTRVRIKTPSLLVNNAADNENLLTATENGAVTLYYDNAAKIATTSTGIDVSGNVAVSAAGARRIDISNTSLADTGEMVSLQWDANADLTFQGRASDGTFKANWYRIEASASDGLADAHRFYTDSSAERMAITSTGIDVTGTVVSDGLTVDGGSANNDSSAVAGKFNANGNEHIRLEISTDSTIGNQAALDLISNSITSRLFTTGSGGLVTSVNGSNRMAIANNGDISFYNDAGNSQDLYWDASTSRLGLGTTSPDRQLSVNDFSGNGTVSINASTTGASTLYFADGNTGTNIYTGFIQYDHSNNAMQFATNGGNERMRITSAGDVEVKGGNELRVYRTDNATYGSMEYLTGAGGLKFKDVNGDGMTFAGPSSDYMRILTGGNVGIGTDSPSNKLDIKGTVGFEATNSTNKWLAYTYTDNSLRLNYNGAGADEVVIDSSGNLFVATTSDVVGDTSGTGLSYASGYLAVSRDTSSADAAVQYLNRTGVHGQHLQLRYDGSSVGHIGSNDNDPFIARTGGNGFRWYSGAVVPTNDSGATADNVMDLGSSIGRFDDIYATNSTIQTSDRNEKQDIEELSEAEQRVAVACKGLLRKFRWKSSVEEKGDDARIHFGIIAQDLQDAFTAEGLDAGRYGMFINSTWTDEETGEEQSRMGVRYSELLAFIISAI